MAEVDWQHFWNTYRTTPVTSDADLFFEVGKTINRRPISEAAFQLSVELVTRYLALDAGDTLLELCCGNGLMTQPLASLVRHVYAVDFAPRLIENALRFRSAPNITYICADAISYTSELARLRTYVPSKILLSDALGYFDPAALATILRSVLELTGGRFVFLANGVPSDELKWSFYNTPERVERYEANQRRDGNTNDGIGRWWHIHEFERLAREWDLHLIVQRQPVALSTFRVDAIFETTCRDERCPEAP